MYKDQINALKVALQKYVRPKSISVRPYIGNDKAFTAPNYYSPAGVPYDLNGVSIILFSPYAGQSKNGLPVARAQVWSEVNSKPDVDRVWEVCMKGTNNKRDDAACK